PPAPKVTNDYYNKITNRNTHDAIRNKQSIPTTTARSDTTPKGDRPNSNIIDKVLAGIPLTDKEIRSVLHRQK
ncbi:unnamed protein product, partial [Adineta steineri]